MYDLIIDLLRTTSNPYQKEADEKMDKNTEHITAVKNRGGMLPASSHPIEHTAKPTLDEERPTATKPTPDAERASATMPVRDVEPFPDAEHPTATKPTPPKSPSARSKATKRRNDRHRLWLLNTATENQLSLDPTFRQTCRWLRSVLIATDDWYMPVSELKLKAEKAHRDWQLVCKAADHCRVIRGREYNCDTDKYQWVWHWPMHLA